VPTNDPAMTVLTPSECLELLAGASVGRVGVSIGALPAILPVHFALLEGSVIFQTSPGSSLDAATNGTVVAFQADDFVDPGPRSWSVLLQGVAAEVSDPEELAAAQRIPMRRWPAPDRGRWVRIQPATVSGRLFG